MDNEEKKEIETPKEGIGGLIGIVIIILMLLLGAIYFYNDRLITIKKSQTAASSAAVDPFTQSVPNDLNSASSTDIQSGINSINKALSK